MNPSTSSELLEKITKLLALTASSNLNEAAVAARKAAQLMKQHSITEADLEAHQPVSSTVVVSVTAKVPPPEGHSMWVGILAGAIGSQMFCKSLYGSETVYFVGRSIQATAAAQMLISLLSSGEAMMAVSAKREADNYRSLTGQNYWETRNDSRNPKKAKRDYRKSFLTGLAMAVRTEIERETEEDKAVQNKVTALVIVRDIENDQFISKTWSKLTTLKTKKVDYNNSALTAGVKAGKELLSDMKTKKIGD